MLHKLRLQTQYYLLAALPFPAGAWLHGDIGDRDIRQFAADKRMQFLKAVTDYLARYMITTGQIIFAAVDDNLLWLIGKYNVIGIHDKVRKGRAAKAAVKNRILRKILLYVLPVGKGRAANK